jgi:hypothetical protein
MWKLYLKPTSFNDYRDIAYLCLVLPMNAIILKKYVFIYDIRKDGTIIPVLKIRNQQPGFH